MPLLTDPAWPIYKAALARLAKAGADLEDLKAGGGLLSDETLQEFADAVLAYEAARVHLRNSGPYPCALGEAPGALMDVDGVPSPVAGLRPGQSHIGVQQIAQSASKD
jgi:hypothetical protein